MKLPLLAAELVRGNRVRSYCVRRTTAGWHAFARQDKQVVEDRHYTDWHRLERALERFKREIAALRTQGWNDASCDFSIVLATRPTMIHEEGRTARLPRVLTDERG